MSIIKFFSKDDLHQQSKLTRTTTDRFNSIGQLRRANAKSIENEISLPISFGAQNSGITVSKNTHLQKFKFTEFILPGDALLQKSTCIGKV